MENLEKAKANLETKEVYTSIKRGNLYVHVGDVILELSEFEISYQAKEYDKEHLLN